jgi:hypothetical protein
MSDRLTLKEAREILRKESKSEFQRPLSEIITSVALRAILLRKRDGMEQFNKAITDYKMEKYGWKKLRKVM